MEEEFAAIHAANSWDLLYRVIVTYYRNCYSYYFHCHAHQCKVKNQKNLLSLQQISNESRNNDFTAVEALKVENKQLNR